MLIDDIPRMDRGVIWGRATEIQRVNPHMESAAAMHYALREYESGRMAGTHDSEVKLAEAARNRSSSLFKKAGR